MAVIGGNSGGNFNITNAGKLYFVKGPLNYFATPTIALVVSATNHPSVPGWVPMSSTGIVTITLTQRPRAPQLAPAIVRINERPPLGSIVYTIAGTNENPAANMTYAAVNGSALVALRVASNGSVIVTNSTYLRFAFHPVLTLLVNVSLAGLGPSYSVVAAIEFDLVRVVVAPVFQPLTLAIAENSPSGSALLPATTSLAKLGLFADQDGLEQFGYSFVGGTGAAVFTVDGSGVVAVGASAALDYEAVSVYTVRLSVSDAGGPVSVGDLTINVTNVNDVAVTGVSGAGQAGYNTTGGEPLVVVGAN